MHPPGGLRFGRADWNKSHMFPMKSSFSFITPCTQRFSAPALKEPLVTYLCVCFSEIQSGGRETRVHVSGEPNMKKCSSGATFVRAKGPGDQSARVPPSCRFKIFLFHLEPRSSSCPLTCVSAGFLHRHGKEAKPSSCQTPSRMTPCTRLCWLRPPGQR